MINRLALKLAGKLGSEQKEGGPGSGIVGHTTDRPEKQGASSPQGSGSAPTPMQLRLELDNMIAKINNDAHFSNRTLSPHEKSLLDGLELTRRRLKNQFEADSGSSNVAALRTQESKLVEKAKPMKIQSSFKEATQDIFKTHKYQVILIREGLGNFGDCFYYTRESLQEAASSKIFEGAQCFADHPTEIEEQVRPERSTRDIIGYFEDVHFEETEGVGSLMGTLVVSNAVSLDWALALLTNSLEYAKKFKETDFVGLSINASGEANAIPLEDFLKSGGVPESAKPKLMQAQAQGISEIKVVSELKEAISCDLVTKAGAGGKILKMLEHERTVMKKAVEMEKKEADPSQADASHADASQDMELFKKMIKQYLGKEDADAEEMEMAKEAYEAYQSEGMEKEAAMEAAGKHLKMALKIGQKMAQKQAKENEAQEASEGKESMEKEAMEKAPSDKKDAPAQDKDKDEDEDKECGKEAHKESKVIKLSAEVAKLKESLKKYELTEYLDQKLASSKKPNSVTKKFREALGSLKSKEQIDSSYKMFMAAFEAQSEDADEGFASFVLTEKAPFRESDKSQTGSFSDCLE
jgi:hypothetical protein